MIDKSSLLERERRWALPAGIITIAAIAVIVFGLAASPVSGDGAAELLRSADEHASAVILLSALQGLGFLLLLPALLYLFNAALGRSDRMRGQMVGVLIVAPIFLAVFAIAGGTVTRDAAEEFVEGSARPELTSTEALADCRSELDDRGSDSFREEFGSRGGDRGALRRCARTELADDSAETALEDASLRPLAEGFGFAGRLGLAAALLYTCLHAMRVGLLTRFWGSLGMALGVFAGLFVLQFVLLWFVYLGLLLAGWVPGGRPPAWAAGEAIPWPVPGQEADEADEADEAEPAASSAAAEPESGPRMRKRKRRR